MIETPRSTGKQFQQWKNEFVATTYGCPRRLIVLAIITVACVMASPVMAQPFVLQHTFDDPTVTGSDRFGNQVAISGNRVLIGDRLDDTAGTNVGQAHLFNATTGALLQTFDDPTITSGDQFGVRVAIDGNNVLIGANEDDTKGTSVGQAHLFNATTGALLHTFNDPTVTTEDEFGGSVAIDGNYVLIGARTDDTNGTNVGQAHLFNATTGAILRTFNDPTITSSDIFGHKVAIDGDNVLIAAPGDDSNGTNVGQAYLFSASTGALLHTFNDPTVTSEDRFGRSVAIDGNFVVIGAYLDDTNGTDVGQAYLFSASTGALLHTFDDPTVTGADQFGESVAVHGNLVLVGAQADDTQGNSVGQAHLFDATTGALLQTFDDPTVTDADLFGHSVAIEGSTVVIGAFYDDTNGSNVGQAHLYSSIPEPSTLVLAALGLLSLGITRRRRRRA